MHVHVHIHVTFAVCVCAYTGTHYSRLVRRFEFFGLKLVPVNTLKERMTFNVSRTLVTITTQSVTRVFGKKL